MRTSSTTIMFILAAVPACAATLAPLTSYQAATQQGYIPVPPAPPLGPAPYQFYDPNPAFSTSRLLRATDANTLVTAADNSLQNRSFYTYSGNGNAFSIDDTHFLARISGGAYYLFNFDLLNFTTSVVKDSAGNPIALPFGNANFSYTDPDIVYGTGWSGFTLQQYDVSTGQPRQLIDLTTVVQPPPGTYMGDMQVAGGYLVADFGGPQQDQHPYCVVYNLSTGTYRFLNFLTNSVYNSADNTTTPIAVNVSGTLYQLSQYGAGLHSIVVDHSGRYVLLAVHSTMPGNGFDVWDTQGNTITNALENAHDDFGYSYSGGGDGNYANSFILHKLDTANIDTPIQLNPNPGGWYFGSHFSWSNSSASLPLAPLFDTTLVDDGYFPGQSPWQKEIIAVCTSCSIFTVWRFANHHCEYNTTDPRTDPFWDQARGNVSQDGRYLLFDSNWEYGLGTDPYTRYPRHDIFIVDLASAGVQTSLTPKVASLSINPSSLTAGSSSTANQVYLNAAAPSGGTVVSLASTLASVAQVPATVTIPGGSTSAMFSIATSPVASSTQVTITASTGGATKTLSLTVTAPQPSYITLYPTTLTSGQTSTANFVYLTSAAPTGGMAVALRSSNAAVQVPSSVTVPAGSTSASFSIATSAVAATTQVSISANAGITSSAALTLNPAPVRVSSVSLSPSAVIGGGSTTQNAVTLASPAPAGGAIVLLASSNPAVARVPASITIPAGAASAPVIVATSPVASSTQVTVTASATGASANAILKVNSIPLKYFTLYPTTVSGGLTEPANWLYLDSNSPSTGTAVLLSSSNPAVASVPATVTIPPGASSASFSIMTSPVTTSTTVTITASAGGVTQNLSLTVVPPQVKFFTLYPTTISGGKTSVANFVYLTSTAPQGGVVVNLSSSDPSVARVPASVTVPVGSTSAAFSIVTTPVNAQRTVTITASTGAASPQVNLTVTPPSLSYLTVWPSSITGGKTSTANFAYLSSPAPTGGVVVTFTSSNPAVAPPPPPLIIPARSTSAAFTIATAPVTTPTPITFTATGGGASPSVFFTVTP